MTPAAAPSAVRDVEINCASCGSHSLCKRRVERHGAEAAARGGDWRSVLDESGRRVGSPMRWCIQEKPRRHAALLSGKDVLEVGCGPLSELTWEYCRDHDVTYLGLEPERLPSRHVLPIARSWQSRLLTPLYELGLTARSRRMRYVKGAFPSGVPAGRRFDVIYGSSSFEHWHEDLFGRDESISAYREDVRACFELLRPGGTLLMDCPFFVHGNPLFIRGDEAAMREIFESAPWESVTYERWGRLRDDLPPYASRKVLDGIRASHGVETDNIWLLNVIARKAS